MKPLVLALLLAVPISFGQVARKPVVPKTQSPTTEVKFNLCGATVTLGQTQDEVLKAVTPACTVSSLPKDSDFPSGDSRWVLETKDSMLPGTLTFNAGRLVEVQKAWSEGRNNTGYGYAQSVYDAFMSVDSSPNGFKATCLVSLSLDLQNVGDTDLTNQYVVLDCNDVRGVHRIYNLRALHLTQTTFGQFTEAVRKQ